MPLFDWGDEYKVNVRELDAQHFKLVELVNNLDKAIIEGTEAGSVGTTLNGLLDYTAYHLIFEEKILKMYGYPEFEAHRREHDELSWKVLDLRSRYNSGDHVEPIEVLEFLTGWLKNHIMNSDKRYGTFLNQKGVF